MPLDPIIVVSAPCHAASYNGSAVGPRAFRHSQTLLGTEAQVRIALRAFQRSRMRCLFSPVPEVFSSPASLTALMRAAKSARGLAERGVVHVRFGPPSEAKVLKQAANMMVLAGARRRGVVPLGAHPMADEASLPAAFGVVCHYGDPAMVRRLGGGAPEFRHLPTAFVAGDLHEEEGEAEPALTARPLEDGLHDLRMQAEAFAEFHPANWGAAARAGGPSTRFRRGLMNVVRGRRLGGGTLGFVALPWNLADPASLVPELLRDFVTFPAFAREGLRLVLLPYNDTGRAGALEALVGEIRDRAARHGAALAEEHLFVARAHAIEDHDLLAQIMPTAIVDYGDAEAHWTAARLGCIGIRPLLLADPDAPPPAEGIASPGDIIALDVERRVRCTDFHGERIFMTKGLSRRSLSRLFVAAMERAGSAAAGAPPRPARSADGPAAIRQVFAPLAEAA